MILLRSRTNDIKIICFYLGKITIAVGLSMVIPLAVSLLLKEYDVACDFVIGSCAAVVFGNLLLNLCRTNEDLNWTQGMVTVAMAWIVAAFFGAVPLYLSAHFQGFLDAYFESMSGFATTGLSLAMDLDHMSRGHNLWRHLTMFLGGQGIVVFALSFFMRGSSGIFRLYASEARDERVLPNVINTARFIWMVSIVYFILGTFALTLIGIQSGLSFGNSVFDAVCLFMAAFDTGGFAPYSQSLLFYHSRGLEIVCMVLMILGALNFKLHYELWQGNFRELTKNIEIIALSASLIFIFFGMSVFFYANGIFQSKLEYFFKGFFQLLSAHTGCGFQTVYNASFLASWKDFAIISLLLAMGFGGAMCSTTGGIKMLRLGTIAKALLLDVNKLLLPESSVIFQRIHHIRDIIIDDRIIRSALFITFCFLGLYLFGAFIGTAFGYGFLPALFESTSAAANVGLSCGITSPQMPVLLKLVYIFQMWAGRLEFIAVFILAGFMVAFVRGK